MCNDAVLILFSLVQLVGSLSNDNIQIIYPKYDVRVRRDIPVESERKLEIIKVGDWNLQLNSIGGNLLIAPGVHAEWISVDGVRRIESLRECDYRTGVVRGLENRSVVAVTICGINILGYVDLDGEPHFIEPLNETTGAHILYSSRKLRRKRSTFSIPQQWMFNLTGDTIDIGGSEDNIELFQRTDEDALPRNEAEFHVENITRGDTSKSQFIPEWHMRHLNDDDDTGYFFDTAWSALKTHTVHFSTSKLPPRWLEIAIGVDYSVISFHGKTKVEQYVLALMNIVSAIYQDPSLEANMKLAITRLMFYENKKQSLVRPGHAKKSLENVNAWNKRLHASLGPNDPKHDLAVWLTRLDIGGPSGYAPVSGVCDPKRSCALNRDEGLTSSFIIAHEMAHILGLSHDGDKKANNYCGDEVLEGSLMAPLVSATFNKFTWSDCSKREFQSVSKKWSCLLNPPKGSDEIELNATLQDFFSMDEQCRMEFGDGYSMCVAFDIMDPCSHLWCGHVKSPYVCKTKKGPPLEGTECGFGKWCVNGYCQEVNNGNWRERVPVVLNPQDGGWSEWSPWGMCSRTCGTGIEFRTRKCNNPEPSYGGKECEGKSEEWRTCNIKECPEPLVDLRAQQCNILPELLNFKHTVKGKLHWLPFESENYDSKCKLICVSKETKELYMSQEYLIDGTPCTYERSDEICVQGKCINITCDGNPNSNIERDLCGVCGGNNKNCIPYSSNTEKTIKREVSRVVVLPRLARHIKVETNVTMHYSDDPAVAFILKNRRKKKYTITVPSLNLHSEIMEGAKFYYTKYGGRHKIWAEGPVLAEMIILLYAPSSEIEAGLNISLSVEYVIHKDALKPSNRYIWIMGGWGPCSVSCGGGKRQKTTACWDKSAKKVVRRKFCSLLQKPNLDTEMCNTFECNFQWVAGEWEPCSATCGAEGVQYREAYCVPNYILNKMLHHNGTALSKPWRFMVNPNKCSDLIPVQMRSCNREPCLMYWKFGEWSQCSVSCGKGITTRTATCPAPSGDPLYTCGDLNPLEEKECRGNYTRSPICKARRKRYCTKDLYKYCTFPLFSKYCSLHGFRRMCCKSCEDFTSISELGPISELSLSIEF